MLHIMPLYVFEASIAFVRLSSTSYTHSNGVETVDLTYLQRETTPKHPCWHVWSCPGQHKLPLCAFHYQEQTHFQILLGLSVGCRGFVNMREWFHMSSRLCGGCVCLFVRMCIPLRLLRVNHWVFTKNTLMICATMILNYKDVLGIFTHFNTKHRYW